MIAEPGVPLDGRLRDWLTVRFEKLVLVVARTVTALNRLLDIVSLIQTDRRVQIVFTTDPVGRAVFRRGVDELLAAMEVAVIDWEHAVPVEFDLIIAASENDRIHQLRGPKILVAHGFGHQKYYPNGRVVAGMNPARLLRDGRVVPTVIGVAHPAQRSALAATCPPAADRVVVIGDPALDRMLASTHRAESYRTAFDSDGRTVVLLASTWGPDSLFGRRPDLPEAVATALCVDRYRLLLLLHPGVWAAHSPWQVRAWLTRAREAGLRVVDSRHWQAALVACHGVIADHSSLALYAAGLRKPLLLTDGQATHTVAGSPLEHLAAATDRLDPQADIGHRIETMLTTPPPDVRTIIERGVHGIGGSARTLRGVLYDHLHLEDPIPAQDYPPAPRPDPYTFSWTTLVASAEERDGVIHLHRVPAVRHGHPIASTGFRHIVADVDTASSTEVSAATIIICTVGDERTFHDRSRRLLTDWPNARLIAMRNRHGDCLIRHREGILTAQVPEPSAGFDATTLASVVYLRLATRSTLPGTERLQIGERIVTVRVVTS